MKKVANHTPGPWFVDQGACEGSGAFGINARAEWGTAYVAETIGGLGEEEANARLIAAAPDLLEALEITDGNIRSLGPAHAGGNPYAEYLVWLEVVEAAIAKARGE